MVKRLMIILLVLTIASSCTGNSPAAEERNTPPAELITAPTAANIPTASPVTQTATPTKTVAPSPTAADQPIEYSPGNFPKNVNPLTGLKVENKDILNRRPLAIKVQIFPRGQRPPMGVSQADIVFDYYQNTGMTRFHAIFYGSDAEQVGPIRSGRLLDIHLVDMFKSILAFGGADQRILRRFYSSAITDRMVLEGSGRCPPLCRIDPNGFNYLVANTAELSAFASENNIDNSIQDLSGLYFTEIPPQGGQSGLQVSLRYSISAYNRWDYDESSGRYLRFQDTVEAQSRENEILAVMTDSMTGEQISAANVIVLRVPHKYAFQTKPGLNEIIDIQLEPDSSGEGLAFRDGQIYQIQWLRVERDFVLELIFPDGTAYPLKPGNTWFQIVGQSSTFEPGPDDDSWRVEFSIP